MKPSHFLTATLSLLAAFSSTVVSADQRTREYRPLDADKVEIRPAARVNGIMQSSRDADKFLSAAWVQFDNRQWADATESFISALEKDPKSRLAAEGLAMSVYRSGDYSSAFKLGLELKKVIPSVQELLSETVVADVQYMISKGEFDAAREFLNHFPSTDSQYGQAPFRRSGYCQSNGTRWRHHQ